LRRSEGPAPRKYRKQQPEEEREEKNIGKGEDPFLDADPIRSQKKTAANLGPMHLGMGRGREERGKKKKEKKKKEIAQV